MTDKELRDAAAKKFQDASGHFKQTTKGYTRMALPLPSASQWGQGYEDFNAGLAYLDQIGVIPEPLPEPEPPEPGTILDRYGIANGYTILNRNATDRAFELDRCVEAGAKWIRFDCTQNDLSKVDAVCQDAFIRNLTVMLILHGSAKPFSAQVAYDFAKLVGTKYRSKRVVYEFCNEPDMARQGPWTGMQYGTAIQGCYRGLKEADPGAKLFAGGIFKCETSADPGGNMSKFISDMYQAGAKGHFDGISVHLYDTPTWNDPRNGWHMTFGPGPNIRQVMDVNGDNLLPIISTESGESTLRVSEATQAQRIAAQMADDRCESMAIYCMLDDPAVPGFGLIRPDRTKRPSWNEYVKAAS